MFDFYLKSPEDYVTLLRKLFLNCRFLSETERRYQDQELKTKQEKWLKKFDSDTEKLIEDVGRIRSLINGDESKLNDNFVFFILA